MPTIDIPEIIIPEIPTINSYISTPYPVLNVPLPNIDLPGCVKTHRDSSVKNTQIVAQMLLLLHLMERVLLTLLIT